MMINVHGLLIPALLGIGAWLLGRWQRKSTLFRHDHTADSVDAYDAADAYEEMVRCAHCGVHLPQSRAVGDSRRGYFCTEEHRQAGASGQF